MRFLRLLVAIVVLAAPLSALAVEPDEMLKDPALEARAREISREVRCMVCQNQSIDDSEAPLARDLRILVRQRLTAGDTDQQVLDFLVARYGEFVLLKPRFETQTLLLWGLPPAVLIGGVIGLFFWSRAQEKERREASELSPAEQARVSTLVESGKD